MLLGSDFSLISREQVHAIRERLQVLLFITTQEDTRAKISQNVKEINDLLNGAGGPEITQ